jgi:hypothetical protein
MGFFRQSVTSGSDREFQERMNMRIWEGVRLRVVARTRGALIQNYRKIIWSTGLKTQAEDGPLWIAVVETKPGIIGIGDGFCISTRIIR